VVAVWFVAAAHLIAAHGQPTSPPVIIETVDRADESMTFWLESSLRRVFPQSLPKSADLELLAARNSRIAFQVCVRNNGEDVDHVTCMVNEADELAPQVRFVGLTPVQHLTLETPLRELEGGGRFIPGLVPDSLWPVSTAEVCPFESRSFWVTLTIPKWVEPGKRTLQVRLTRRENEELAAELPIQLTIAPLVLKPRHDFPVTHWWWPQSTWDQHKTGMFDERWWRITRAQMENMFAHGCDVVYVPIFFFSFPKTVERPGQMLIVREPAPGVYQFDWSHVKRFTDMCREIGFRQFEWSHLWRNWTVASPPIVYKLEGRRYIGLWPADEPLLSPKYTTFMKQFLPDFKKFLDQERLLDRSYFHLADEPQNLANYGAAREFLRREAPWIKVMDAVQDIEIAEQKLTDIPVCLVSVAGAYEDEDIPHWVYFCCVPTGDYLNRFMDTPLPKIRMAGWTFYRLRANGFLHWGFNYWNKLNDESAVNPFVDATAGSSPGIPAGDPFVIYPGPDGRPLDSIRWEVFAESLQDYALLQTAGISPDDESLDEIKSYKDFPKSEPWLDETRRRILLPSQEQSAVKGAAN
jgi:hypothetical protein